MARGVDVISGHGCIRNADDWVPLLALPEMSAWVFPSPIHLSSGRRNACRVGSVDQGHVSMAN